MSGLNHRYKKKILRNTSEFVCVYCGKQCNPNEIHIDHIIPKSRGGVSKEENYQIACIRCNLTKNNKTNTEFYEKIMRLKISAEQDLAYYNRVIECFELKPL